MPNERDIVLHSWCVPGDWNAPTVVGGRGAKLLLEDGREILDMSSLVECSNLGHQHPKLVAALKAQADKLAFVTAHRYAQAGEDEWHDGMLTATRISTTDDGARTLVTAEMRGERLIVVGPAGEYALPLGSMTDLNFWNETITRQPRLIDSQNGELVTVTVRADGIEQVQARGALVEARRFAMEGSRNRSGLVWYDQEGTLVKAEVHTRGRTLDYRLVA